jgi:flagellar motility protein MotE (MotC chaperone)
VRRPPGQIKNPLGGHRDYFPPVSVATAKGESESIMAHRRRTKRKKKEDHRGISSRVWPKMQKEIDNSDERIKKHESKRSEENEDRIGEGGGIAPSEANASDVSSSCA